MINAKQYLIDLVKAKTGIWITEEDVEFSNPIRQPDGSTRNTKITVYPKPWLPLVNGFDLYYNRTHTSEVRPFRILKGTNKTTHDVLDVINHEYDYNFTEEEINNKILPNADVSGYTHFYLFFTENCIGFYNYQIVITADFLIKEHPLPDPIDVSDPYVPVPYQLYLPHSTIVGTVCIDGSLWRMRSSGNEDFVYILYEENSPTCTVNSFRVVNKNNVVNSNRESIVTYKFEQPLEEDVEFVVSAISNTGLRSDIKSIEYKINTNDPWVTLLSNNKLIVPKGRNRFCFKVVMSDTDVKMILLGIYEKPSNKILTNKSIEYANISVSEHSNTPVNEYHPSGAILNYICVGTDLICTYANGSGGTYTETIETNSLACGYTTKPNLTVNVSTTTVTEDSEIVLIYTLTSITTTDLKLNINLNNITTDSYDIGTIQYRLLGGIDYMSIPSDNTIIIPIGIVKFFIKLKILLDDVSEINEVCSVTISETEQQSMLLNSVPITTTITIGNKPVVKPTLSSDTNELHLNINDDYKYGIIKYSLTNTLNVQLPLMLTVTYLDDTDPNLFVFKHWNEDTSMWDTVASGSVLTVPKEKTHFYISIDNLGVVSKITDKGFDISLEDFSGTPKLNNTEPLVVTVKIPAP